MREGSRLRVLAQDNLSLIRSGQDWSDTESAERKLYLEEVEPALREGMDFLRDEGQAIGCYANRHTLARPNGRASRRGLVDVGIP